jgi:type I restriction enzyme S subunit
MDSELKDYKLADLGHIITGRTPPGTLPDLFGGPMPFLTPTDMDGRRSVGATARTLSARGTETLQNVVVSHGVAVSCIGWQMGKPILIDCPIATNQQINSIKTNRALVDDLYLYYNLLGRRDEIFRLGAGGTRTPILNKSDFGAIRISLPPLPAQRSVGAVLGTLDDKIELNRRMNETLEAIVRAIFNDWFVDCGPTRAKMEGRAPYLTPDIWSLFPERLDDEGKPEGWMPGSVGDVASLVKDTVNLQLLTEELFSHHSIPAYDSGQRPVLDRGADIKSNKTVVPGGAILLSKLNPEIPRVWLTDICRADRAVCSTEFLVMLPSPPAGRSFLFGLFHSPSFRDSLRGMVTGTSNSHQRVKPQGVLDLEIARPSRDCLTVFEKTAGPLVDRTISNRREVGTLAALRDLLLPKLMSGEIRIKDAENIVGEAT